MISIKLELVNDYYTLVTLPNDVKVIFKTCQEFLYQDPDQAYALLQLHQVWDFGIIEDDCTSRHLSTSGSPGTQCIKVGDKSLYMYFDSWKCYYKIDESASDDLVKYEIIKLTSRLSYEPQRIYSRRAATIPTKELEAWRFRLDLPTYALTTLTLVNTTQMLQTLQAETREYMRDHYKTRFWALRPHHINDVMYSDAFFASMKSIQGFKCLLIRIPKSTD